MACAPRWGAMPSAEMKLPADMADNRAPRIAEVAAPAPTGSGVGPDTGKPPHGFRDVWYGFYPNGREMLLGVESAKGDNLTAVYAIGPSIDNKHEAAWSRRKGRIAEDDSFVFEEKGKSTLRFRPRQDGGLAATWISADGKTSMTAHLKPIDPGVLAKRAVGGAKNSAPVAPAAAHGHGNQTED
jgi:hypothetical protein